MMNFFKVIFIFVFFYLFLETKLWSKTQIVILTGPEKTGSNIFATELMRISESSKINSKFKIVKKVVTSQQNRFEQIKNHGISLAIVDSKTSFENLKKSPSIRVLSVLWENWLYAIGNVQKQFLTLDSTRRFLIHENSVFFAQFWKKFSPKTEFKWFNGKNIPNFEKGFSEEVLIFMGPKYLQELNYWLDQFAGIHLLSFDKKLINSLSLKYEWLLPKKLAPGSYPYQSESFSGMTSKNVLITHRNFSFEIATDLLKIIFSQKEKLNPHLLFKDLEINQNIIFKKTFPYHSATVKMFKF